MKPDKLRNLLVELETRVDRLERSYSRTTTASIIAPLATLRAEVRRHLAKVDSLRASDVASLEEMVAQVLIPVGHQGLDNIILGLKIGLNQLGPDELLDVLPGQKTAAFHFSVDDDALKAIDQPLRPSSREKDMAMAALEGAVEHGEYVIGELAGPTIRRA
ncbi:hypothetical protein QO004_003253 [Rhizobium mesoamericanum]|uniref:hypothetical protein n=1 Tax=Rhizobium mesoamericanum TaxID=1079800 RepID=UPI00278A6C07|nr:hypothetical protein [Rhizobium mesoamericanum]MDQ0561459.1 hypothetical protein [Rhizobium mesoamericanum]